MSNSSHCNVQSWLNCLYQVVIVRDHNKRNTYRVRPDLFPIYNNSPFNVFIIKVFGASWRYIADNSSERDININCNRSRLQLPDSEEGASYAYCYDEENCTGGQYCHVQTHQCVCHEGSYPDETETCPTVGNRCSSCCCGKNVFCNGEICQLYEVDVVSSQMILSIVMVMGLVSIIFMVYRMCYRNTL